MKQQEMIKILEKLVPQEGLIDSAIDQVMLFRITHYSPRTPALYDPSIIILLQGKKKIFLGNDIFSYDPLHYLVLSVPLPIECETTASPDEPMLGVTIKVNPAIVSEIVLEMEKSVKKIKTIPKGIYSAPLSENITDVISRLLKTLDTPNESKILGPMIVREIIYRVLSEETTGALRSLAYRDRHFYQIASVLEIIHESFQNIPNLNDLAEEVGMSISTFHAAFKEVTGTSPLQYIKNVKLHKARSYMLHDGEYVYEAATKVGYESVSQFSREYKRLFGVSPGKDAVSA